MTIVPRKILTDYGSRIDRGLGVERATAQPIHARYLVTGNPTGVHGAGYHEPVVLTVSVGHRLELTTQGVARQGERGTAAWLLVRRVYRIRLIRRYCRTKLFIFIEFSKDLSMMI